MPYLVNIIVNYPTLKGLLIGLQVVNKLQILYIKLLSFLFKLDLSFCPYGSVELVYKLTYIERVDLAIRVLRCLLNYYLLLLTELCTYVVKDVLFKVLAADNVRDITLSVLKLFPIKSINRSNVSISNNKPRARAVVFYYSNVNLAQDLYEVLLFLTVEQGNTELNCRIYTSNTDNIKQRPIIDVSLIRAIKHKHIMLASLDLQRLQMNYQQVSKLASCFITLIIVLKTKLIKVIEQQPYYRPLAQLSESLSLFLITQILQLELIAEEALEYVYLRRALYIVISKAFE